MDLLLITGAGASRQLGVGGKELPLMPDWANALCGALDSVEPGLALACGLEPGMSGEDFEEALGRLLRWRQVRDLEQRFLGLGGSQPNAVETQVQKHVQRTTARLRKIIETINDSLYAEFGQARIDDERASTAYGALLRELDVTDLTVATTNYDRAGEAALSALGREVDTGFRSRPGRTPTLDVRGIAESRSETRVPFLHLHGSIGWYEREGSIFDHLADQPFNPTLGTPVVLYPNPHKDVTNDATVSEIWTEFGEALARTDHVLVVGHSLNDQALVDAIEPSRV